MDDQFDDQFDDRMVVSQQPNDEIMTSQKVDVNKIYEFNEDEEFEDVNGFQLSGINKNSQTDHQDSYESSSDEEWSPRSDLSSSPPQPPLNSLAYSPKQDQEVEDFPSFANLNDYVTLKFFKLLTLIELQQTRLVCKKWRILADQIRVRKLSLVYFSSKHSWSSEENFENLLNHPDAIDMKSLVTIEQVLLKPQFRDLVHLILISDYANAPGTLNLKLLELDVSRFQKLRKLELFGTMIFLKEDQKCETLTHLSIEHVTVNLLAVFPNLVYLRTNVLTTSPITSPTLERLEFFNSERDMSLIQDTLKKLCPNIHTLSCYLLNAFSLLTMGSDLANEFQLKQLQTIKIFFNSFTVQESLFDYLVQAAKSLNIGLEFHVNKNKEKTDLLRWIKFFKARQIDVYFFAGKEVNLRDFFRLPNYENNTLLRQNLKVDSESLSQINDNVYQYLFITNSIELNGDNLEPKFNRLLRTIPSVTKLTVNCPLQQSTFDRFKAYCPSLSHLKISTQQAYPLDLSFIHHLDHLTSLKLINLHLVNVAGIVSKVKFSKFLHVLEFRHCLLDTDDRSIFKAMIEKAKKNQGKFYEITILPEQPDHKAKLNEQFKDAPQNFYSNIFRLI